MTGWTRGRYPSEISMGFQMNVSKLLTNAICPQRATVVIRLASDRQGYRVIVALKIIKGL